MQCVVGKCEENVIIQEQGEGGGKRWWEGVVIAQICHRV